MHFTGFLLSYLNYQLPFYPKTGANLNNIRSSKRDVFSRASSERRRRKVTKEVKRKDKIYLERERWENHFDPCVQLFGFYVEIQEHVNLASS